VNILSLQNAQEALKIRLSDPGRVDMMSQREFDYLLGLFQALWIYPGEPRAEVAHAITRAEECTDGFVNCMALLDNVNLCEMLAYQLVMRLRARNDCPDDIRLIVDAAYSGTDLGNAVARIIMRGQICSPRHRTVEKDKEGNPTKFRGTVKSGENVLVVNELMTTPEGSTQMAKNAVITVGATPDQFVPYALVLVDRSGVGHLQDGTLVLSVGQYNIKTYKPGPTTCPYCAAGSPRYKPKEGDNWQLYFSQ
jgi:orotate phosphoribosyltransferase